MRSLCLRSAITLLLFHESSEQAQDSIPTSTSLHAAPLLGDVAVTTVNGTDVRTGKSFIAGENIFGPFDNGFTSAQDHILHQLGCRPSSLGHTQGGIDLATTEKMIAFQCGITLPRVEYGGYISLLDECGARHTGGHAHEYNFHLRLSCLYDDSVVGHSLQVGRTLDGKFLYGKWEHSSSRKLPLLDACGAQYGFTPDSPSVAVYHYHVQDRPPFTIGCFGPNDDGSLVTVSQCRSFYSGCDGDLVTITTSSGAQPYDRWCPCFDAQGVNSGVNFVELAAFTTTTTTASGVRGWSLYRLVPLKLRGGSQSVQIAEIAFRFRGAPVSLVHASAFVERGAGGQSPPGAEPMRAIDGRSETRWIDYNLSPLSIQLPHATPVDSYTFITATDDMTRDPVQWRLEGSNDGGMVFDVLHEVLSDYRTPTDRSHMLEWFRIPRCLEVTGFGGNQICMSTSRLIAQGLVFPDTPS